MCKHNNKCDETFLEYLIRTISLKINKTKFAIRNTKSENLLIDRREGQKWLGNVVVASILSTPIDLCASQLFTEVGWVAQLLWLLILFNYSLSVPQNLTN